MKLLAVDTATEACSAALWLDGAVVARSEYAGRSHTQRLLPMVHGLIADAGIAFTDLDGLVCGAGPGSFAGIRIGIGYIKGLALALDRPTVPVSSLAMLALQAIDSGADIVLPAVDARMDEVYFGAYRRDGDGVIALMPDRVAAPSDVGVWPISGADPDARDDGVGTGWGRYEATLRASFGLTVVSVDPDALPDARSALKLAISRFERGDIVSAEALEPSYLRDRVALDLREQAIARAANRR